MTRNEKIRAQIDGASANLRFGTIDAYLKGLGATARQSGTSHVMYALDGIPIGFPKPHKGCVKVVYVKQIAKALAEHDALLAEQEEVEDQ